MSKTYQPAQQPKPAPFENPKKGEVNELRILLKNAITNEKNPIKRREVIKKVIAFQTLGIDVSKLFGEMAMASQTDDLIQKKMVYLYLSNYAEQNPDLCIMAINTFKKDLNHQEAKIRGLALRNLCSLRFSGSLEYLLPAIQEALHDSDPYVRKTAIMGSVKLYYIDKEIITKTEIVETLYSLIKDVNPLVIQNAIEALNEILQDDGGIAISSKMIIYLLNRIKEFNEWGQTIILNMVSNYKPKTEQEMIDILNLLDDRLKHACTSIVLGCIKVFLNFTNENELLHNKVLERVSTPLITLMTSSQVSGTYELTYAVLAHILFIVQRGGSKVFESQYKHFYCKYDEPSYIKHIKLNILEQIASEQNLGDILNELGEYVTDVNQELARKSIRALSGIAIRLKEMATPIVKQLTMFISIQNDYITNETLVAFKNILRKYPSEYHEISLVINSTIDFISEAESKLALIWILGEFGEHIENAPYIIENYVDNLKNSKEELKVKQFLLITTIKLFLKRPPEMQTILGSLFQQILNSENEDLDLKDRAAFYYRAMQVDINSVSKILQIQVPTQGYLEDQETLKDDSAIEFNTLSVIYGKPEYKFTKPYEFFNQQRTKEANEEKNQQDQQQQNQEDQSHQQSTQDQTETTQTVQDDNLLETSQSASQPSQQQQQHQQQQQQQQKEENLLDLQFTPQISQIQLHDLIENVEIDPEQFQSTWMNLSEGAIKMRNLKSAASINEKSIEDLFQKKRIYCIASGEMDGEIKFYFYAKYAPVNTLMFLECQIDKNQNTLSLNVKCETENDELCAFFSKFIENIFSENGML